MKVVNTIKIENCSLENMKLCYGHLFVIETTVRKIINQTLLEEFGVHWSVTLKRHYKNNITNKPLENMYFHELLSLISLIPKLKQVFGGLDKNFYELIPIRNKIAHCIIINEKEFSVLILMSEKVSGIWVENITSINASV